MEQLQKLDLFVIDDDIHLTSEELMDRARLVMNERCSEFGWMSCEVRLASPAITKKSSTWYEFAIFGLPAIDSGTSDSPGARVSPSLSKSAAKDAEV